MTVLAGQSIVTATALTGSNGAGPISAPGLKVGDRAFAVFLTTAGHISHQNPADFIEAIVSVADEIQQLDTSDLTASSVDVYLIRLP